MGLQRLLQTDAVWSRRLSIPEHRGGLRSAAALLAHSGDSWFWLLGLGLVWLASPAWRSLALRVGVSVLLLAAVVLAVKFLVRRPRPAGEWGAIYRNTDPHSFPSGHAARAGLLVCLVWLWGPVWLALFFTSWAPLMSLARVGLGVHYISDVAAGLALGLLAGLLIGAGGPALLPVLFG